MRVILRPPNMRSCLWSTMGFRIGVVSRHPEARISLHSFFVALEADDRIILYYQAKKLLPARVSHRTYVLQSSAPLCSGARNR